MATTEKDDTEAIETFLTNPVDSAQLQELKTASSLVEAPNVDKRYKEEDLQHIFKNITEIKERNIQMTTGSSKKCIVPIVH